jgi:hypothetical protein
MTTAIPPTEFTRIIQTSSSPETIAALLNKAERTHSPMRKRWHGNRKYVYPFWKTCEVCSKPFPCENCLQAKRNRTCSPECFGRIVSARKVGVPRVRMARYVVRVCPQCGKEREVRAKQVAMNKNTYCSHSCRAKAFASRLLPYCTNMKGRTRKDKKYGSKNPAWKGGVTYLRTHGNYGAIKYVRCPADFLPMARKDGYVMEHRLLVARALGRLLLREEVVHHDDHNPKNNAISNLMLFASNRDHKLYEHRGSPEPIWRGSSQSITEV